MGTHLNEHLYFIVSPTNLTESIHSWTFRCWMRHEGDRIGIVCKKDLDDIAMKDKSKCMQWNRRIFWMPVHKMISGKWGVYDYIQIELNKIDWAVTFKIYKQSLQTGCTTISAPIHGIDEKCVLYACVALGNMKRGKYDTV